jgi:hypothetical protein
MTHYRPAGIGVRSKPSCSKTNDKLGLISGQRYQMFMEFKAVNASNIGSAANASPGSVPIVNGSTDWIRFDWTAVESDTAGDGRYSRFIQSIVHIRIAKRLEIGIGI